MSDLFSKSEKDYGENYKEHLFEQYKLYVESIEKTSDRRQHANNYFITINTALISFIGLSFQYRILENVVWIKSLLSFVGILICIVFWLLIRSYKQLNTGKFIVIHEIEKHLPVALYKYEWEILGEGKNRKIYYPFSHIELFIPWVFGAIYVLLFCYFLSFPSSGNLFNNRNNSMSHGNTIEDVNEVSVVAEAVSQKPVIDIEINNLPPYKSADEKTEIQIKNVGQIITGPNPEILVKFSWINNYAYKLLLPSEDYRLDINERYTWKIRLDENYPENGTIQIVVKDKNGSGWFWVSEENLVANQNKHRKP